MPDEPAFPVLLITGELYAGLQRECARKRIRCLEAPVGLARLQEELALLLE